MGMGRGHDGRRPRTRRAFLNSAAVAGASITAASVMATTGLGSAGDLAEAAGGHTEEGAGEYTEEVAAILNLLATAETLAVTFYYATLTGATFYIDARAVESLALVLDAAMGHLAALRSLGGRSLRDHVYLPDRLRADARVFVTTGMTIETTLAGAYLAATQQFAVQGRPLLAAVAARHAASAAQHLTLIGHLAGLPAHDLTLALPAFHQVSDAGRALTPYLAGGPGVSGPIGVPSTRQCRAVRDARTAGRMQPVVTT